MEPIPRDLEEKWMPALVATWRQARRREGPEDALLPAELREVGAAVRRLSLGLTRERELAGARYMDDPELLGAYLLFYWPISYAQGRQVLGELVGEPHRALDLGAGPAPLAMAALDHGAAEATAADRSDRALDVARVIAAKAGRSLHTARWDGLAGGELPEGSYDLITLGHVVNELWTGKDDASSRRAALLEGLLDLLRPGGSLVVVEPALRETSRGLLEVRDRLVSRGIAVRAPCLFRGACPALEKPTDWCHAERGWSPPPLVQAIADEAGIHKQALKMSYLILSPKGEAWPELEGRQGIFRIVSEPLHVKGRLRYIGCGPEGRIGLALQAKHLGDATAAFRDLVRGDVIAVEQTEEKGDGLALGPSSVVRRLASAGAPLPHLRRQPE